MFKLPLYGLTRERKRIGGITVVLSFSGEQVHCPCSGLGFNNEVLTSHPKREEHRRDNDYVFTERCCRSKSTVRLDNIESLYLLLSQKRTGTYLQGGGGTRVRRTEPNSPRGSKNFTFLPIKNLVFQVSSTKLIIS